MDGHTLQKQLVGYFAFWGGGVESILSICNSGTPILHAMWWTCEGAVPFFFLVYQKMDLNCIQAGHPTVTLDLLCVRTCIWCFWCAAG